MWLCLLDVYYKPVYSIVYVPRKNMSDGSCETISKDCICCNIDYTVLFIYIVFLVRKILLLQLDVLVLWATEEELCSLDTRVDNYCARLILC